MSLTELAKVLAVSETGIAVARGIPVSLQGQAGVSGVMSGLPQNLRNSIYK